MTDPILAAYKTIKEAEKTVAFNPQEVANRLKDEFYDWEDQQDPDRYDDNEWNLGYGYWPMVEDFLKDRYPAAHRGFMCGQEDASHFIDNPQSGKPDRYTPWSRYSDEESEDYDPSYDPEPYASDPKTIQQLGYDPSEIAAGMVLLHNQRNRPGLGYEDLDKQRLVDIFKTHQEWEKKNRPTINKMKKRPGLGKPASIILAYQTIHEAEKLAEFIPPPETTHIYRGMRVNLPPEIIQAAQRNDPETGHHILNWLGSHVGRHWSTDKKIALMMGEVYDGQHNIRLTGELPHPRHRVPVGTSWEKEVRLRHGAPVNITGLEIGLEPGEESIANFPITPRQMNT